MEIKIDLKESELGSLYNTATESFIHDQSDRLVMYDEGSDDYCAWIETDFQSFLSSSEEEEDNSAPSNDNNIVLVAGENTTELMMDLARSSIAHLNPLSTVTINEELIAADIPEGAVQVIYPDDTVEIFEGGED